MKTTSLLIVGTLMFAIGCGRVGEAPSVKMATAKPAMAQIAAKDAKQSEMAPADPEKLLVGRDHPVGADFLVQGQDAKPIQRKIKYTADIRLITDDFAKAQKELIDHVDNHKGIIARSDIIVSPGSNKVGTWTVRIPVADFRAFCDEILKIAEVQKNSTNSEDMTERFTDLASQIKNRQDHVKELAKLRDKGGDIKYLLTVYKEIGETQMEIDRIQGQLNLIANVTDLTTVNITISERQKYNQEKPPKLTEKPDFGTRAGKTFEGSTEALKDFGQGLVIFIIATAPWLPIVFVVIAPVWFLLRQHHQSQFVVAKRAPAAPKFEEKP